MKKYKPTTALKIFITLSFLFMIALPITAFIIWPNEANLKYRLFTLILVLFGIVGIRSINKHEIIIDEQKISVFPLFPRGGTLFWSEITQLTSEYFLFPETGVINLISNSKTEKRFIRISIMGMPIELIRDILSHLPQGARIYLYPYLKHKVE